jgi:hypothetical protein
VSQREPTVLQANALKKEMRETRELKLSSSVEVSSVKGYCTLVAQHRWSWLLVMTSPRRRALHQDGIWYLLSSTVASTGRWTSQECSSQEVGPWNITDHQEIRPEFYIAKASNANGVWSGLRSIPVMRIKAVVTVVSQHKHISFRYELQEW